MISFEFLRTSFPDTCVISWQPIPETRCLDSTRSYDGHCAAERTACCRNRSRQRMGGAIASLAGMI